MNQHCHLVRFAEPAKMDNIDKTVDYKEITKGIIKLVEGSEFFLIETLAERIAGTV